MRNKKEQIEKPKEELTKKKKKWKAIEFSACTEDEPKTMCVLAHIFNSIMD